jgi:hypothetical protein
MEMLKTLLCPGAILLEIGLDDLDYMDITVLAHRKASYIFAA